MSQRQNCGICGIYERKYAIRSPSPAEDSNKMANSARSGRSKGNSVPEDCDGYLKYAMSHSQGSPILTDGRYPPSAPSFLIFKRMKY